MFVPEPLLISPRTISNLVNIPALPNGGSFARKLITNAFTDP